jgi:SSS family solute:Na+ symporter
MPLSDTLIIWAIVAAYMAFIFVKGISKARRIGDTDDFLVAGRNVGWFMLFCTMGATVIGGGSSIGAIGKTYDWGVLMLLVSTGWYLHFIFSGLVVAPQFRRAELYTVAGYFGHRFGEGPRFVMMVLSLLFSVFIVAAQMAAFGSVLATLMPEFADMSRVLAWAILIGGAMVVIYSTAGGLLAVIHTDVYQFVILLAGFGVTLLFCVPDIAAASLEEVPRWFFLPQGNRGWLFLVTTFLAFLLGETFAPGYATRYCVGRDVRETRRGIAGVGVFLALVFPAVLFCIALYARVHFPDIDPQQALPMVIMQLHNPWVAGLMIGALMMAVMSSADSALNSATTIFVKDLFEHQLGWKDRGDGRMLRLARIWTVLLGCTAIAVAVSWPDIIGLLLFTYHIWAPAVILPVCVGALVRKRSPALTRNIFVTMIAATGLTLLYRAILWVQGRGWWSPLGEDVFGLLENLDPSVFGVAASCVVFFLLSLRVRMRRSGSGGATG